MVTGQKIQNLLFEPPGPTIPQKSASMGRNAELHEEQCICIVHRHFYNSMQNPKMAAGEKLNLTAGEFFKDPVTIYRIINDRLDLFLQLKKENHPIRYFKEKYPQYSW